MIGLADVLSDPFAHMYGARGRALLALLEEHLLPRPPPLSPAEAVERLLAGCACGNPTVIRDKPCAGCGATPVPTRAHPERCPRCGVAGDEQVSIERDVLRGEVVIVAACHGAASRVSFRSSILAENAPSVVAEKVAEAIAGLADAPAMYAARRLGTGIGIGIGHLLRPA